MSKALLISVRFHDGRYHGAGDWPPSPARLFQALVAAAARPRLNDEKRKALRWFEKLDAPMIAAPTAYTGQPINLFVPNNDLDAKDGDIRRIAEIRSATKRIRPRLFDATVPLLYIWHFDGDESQAQCICNIADGLYQLGRGVDMAWAVGEQIDEARTEKLLSDYPGAIYRPSRGGKGLALDCPDEGSLVSLETRHQANAQRFSYVNGKIQFANAPKPRFRAVAYNSTTTHLLFELRCTTAPGTPFAPWPLKSAAALVRTLRDGACARLERHFNGSGVVEKVLIGRNATEADKTQRVRIIPLPSIGHVHAHPGIRRVLVEVPPNCPIRVDDMVWGFAGLEVAPPVHDDVTGEILSSPVELVRTEDDSMLAHYGVEEEHSARLWRSVTPLVLPEDAKRRRIPPARPHEEIKSGKERADEQRRVCHTVLQALRHAGRREKVVGIRVQREPFSANGERAEAFANGTRFSKHQLWHAEIEFAEAVCGPLILGNGRYCGLGLMAPVQQVEGVVAFSIVDGLAADAEPLHLARALRRAVMARVRDIMHLRDTDALPVFFCGHELDASTARRGVHTHLAFVPDLARQRLLVIAPHLIEHRNPFKDEYAHLKTLERALAGLSELRAGRAGKLDLEQVDITPEADPLFAASREWTSTTPYVPTRHAKRNGSDSLHEDVLQEVQRRRLPAPFVVWMKGRSLLLQFKVAVPGPVLLGKTMHFGGGLFACSM
ncbi:type I-G CRISPR-associated protein Csb2 [Pseudacidobacterium ailaaui]|jgi:CRISPR-associated protein Csb2|uniref:type I-G CRISPR-associated protein Csb2 n=1 Tax=Pseudacidobacterium ailaaui TaxID=1382359 RepID=UPI000679ABE4|nr:type I-U CRISPR-associated protein Csb2 [Pseudacidobacterium ailaaui]